MTELKKKTAQNAKSLAEAVVLLAVYSMAFVFSAQIKTGAINSLSLCAKVIIPSVFPVMVISNTLLLHGFPAPLVRAASVPSKLFFGLSGNSAVCMLFGLTGGYPVGVKTARLMYAQKLISADEAKRICLTAVSPGLSFTITVCSAFFSSAAAGLTLFFSCLAANIAIGTAIKIICGKPKAKNADTAEAMTISEAFLSAVEKSTAAVISVCSFIIVFSSATALSDSFLPTGVNEAVKLISEVTAGVQLAAEKRNIIIAAFLCGFGGISVAVQLLPDLKALGIRAYSFLLCRAATGFFAALFEFVTVTAFKLSFPVTRIYTGQLFSNTFSGSLFLFGTALMLIVTSLDSGIHPRNSSL
ncbi:MAG: hypothetical protein SOX69_03985 [Oscillospiraceae bacterium]|nr:hypothetical protein [Oscillospiraceae bacterium]